MKKYRALVYDSGIGGLNVLAKLVKRYGGIDFYYLSDSKNCPYGNKSVGELNKISSLLLTKIGVNNFDFVILACNTLTTNCLKYLSERFKLPFLGVRPPLDLGGKTLLLCTQATAKSRYVKTGNKNFTVYPCVGLVEDIEKHLFFLEKKLSEKYTNFFPRGNFDNVVLGCTHFIYAKAFLSKLYTNSHFYDGTEELLGILDHRYDEILGQETIFNHQQFLPKKCFLGGDKERNFAIVNKIIQNPWKEQFIN